jgi:hypothetical protein
MFFAIFALKSFETQSAERTAAKFAKKTTEKALVYYQ